jgi:hypothetical protein
VPGQRLGYHHLRDDIPVKRYIAKGAESSSHSRYDQVDYTRKPSLDHLSDITLTVDSVLIKPPFHLHSLRAAVCFCSVESLKTCIRSPRLDFHFDFFFFFFFYIHHYNALPLALLLFRLHFFFFFPFFLLSFWLLLSTRIIINTRLLALVAGLPFHFHLYL